MKAALVLLLCLLSGALCAGSNRHRTDRNIECDREAMGSVYRAEGHAPRIVWMQREQMVGDEPKDAIHIRDDNESAEKKAAWEASLLIGWHAQDDWMADHNGVARSGHDVYVACMGSEHA